MKMKPFPILVAVAVLLPVLGGVVLAAQDRYSLKVPDGLSFSEFQGYDTWRPVSVSATKDGIKLIAANAVMLNAYKSGLPANGKTFPEGSKVVKIEWAQQQNTKSPYYVVIPKILKNVAFIEKDSKRFPKTHGWAYAKFDYDASSKMFKPEGTGAECGFACHTIVASQDYIFTAYPTR